MSVGAALRELQTNAAFMSQVTAWHVLPPVAPRTAPWPLPLHPQLREVLNRQGISAPYLHQARAITALAHGRDVILVTPTASGKSLVYLVPLFQSLLEDPRARGLLLFPTKALAQDQRRRIEAWAGALGLTNAVGVYDGDTPQQERARVRRQARLLITNPDMLHHGILPHHTRWADLWRGLRYIVLDEVHTYRGIFGAHVANVLRRLARVLAFYQGKEEKLAGRGTLWGHVRLIYASATIGNPADLVRRLTGRESTVIDESTAPHPARTLIFYNPPLVDATTGMRRSALLEARRLALHFLRHNVQTVLFAPSRRSVEVLLTYLRDAASEVGLPPEAIRGYRGGYLPATRRAIEAGLRDGSVRAVVATNALELGVDIGSLGASILVGYPGSIAAMWQQFGRAGRRDEGGVGVYIAGAGALDQYLVTHPEFVLRASPEHALVAPNNLHVLLAHVRCALFELPFDEDEPFGDFSPTREVLDFLVEVGEARRAGRRFYWLGEDYPAAEVSLRTAAGERVGIFEDREGRAVLLGEVDRVSAPRLVHPGAIYLHEGETYIVDDLDWDTLTARVRPVQVEYYTQPLVSESLTVLEEWQGDERGSTARYLGEVRVRSQVVAFRKVRWYTHEVLGIEEVDVPPQEMETIAYWLTFSAGVLEQLRAQGLWRSDAILDYGPNWSAQRRRALERDGYRCQRCGAPHTPERPLHVHHIRPFRTFGYIPGVNDAYREANRLDNLITLCSRCHRLAEAGARLRTGFSGVAYALGELAPLFVMAAAGDIGQVVEAQSPYTGLPTITLYDNVPGGIGLAERLYEVHEDLLRAAWERIRGCACEHGCPGCVGPVLVTEASADDADVDTKTLALALLQAVLESLSESPA